MYGSRTTQAGIAIWCLLVIGGANVVSGRYEIPLPEWAGFAIVGLLCAVGGGALMGRDWLRWRRLAGSFGLTGSGSEAGGVPVPFLDAYRGTYEGRTVTLDYNSGATINKTIVTAEHDATVEDPVIIERVGAGGTGSSDLPPEVELFEGAFAEQFSVHSADPELARTAVTTGVQTAITELEDPIDIVVEGDRVRARTQGRVLDADVVEGYLGVVCRLADEVEART